MYIFLCFVEWLGSVLSVVLDYKKIPRNFGNALFWWMVDHSTNKLIVPGDEHIYWTPGLWLIHWDDEDGANSAYWKMFWHYFGYPWRLHVMPIWKCWFDAYLPPPPDTPNDKGKSIEFNLPVWACLLARAYYSKRGWICP